MKHEKKKLYQKTWFIILLLVVFFPVGLFLMWKFSSWKTIVKIIVSAVVAIVVVTGVIVIIHHATDPKVIGSTVDENGEVVNLSKISLRVESDETFDPDTEIKVSITGYQQESNTGMGYVEDRITIDELNKTQILDYKAGYYRIKLMTSSLNKDGKTYKVASQSVTYDGQTPVDVVLKIELDTTAAQ